MAAEQGPACPSAACLGAHGHLASVSRATAGPSPQQGDGRPASRLPGRICLNAKPGGPGPRSPFLVQFALCS